MGIFISSVCVDGFLNYDNVLGQQFNEINKSYELRNLDSSSRSLIENSDITSAPTKKVMEPLLRNSQRHLLNSSIKRERYSLKPVPVKHLRFNLLSILHNFKINYGSILDMRRSDLKLSVPVNVATNLFLMISLNVFLNFVICTI